MSNPWKKVVVPSDVQNLSDIMSEEYAKGLQVKENIRFAEEIADHHVVTERDSSNIPPEVLNQIEQSNVKEYCDSGALIAKVMQCQFDKEYDDGLKLVEKKLNGDSKVSVSYNNDCNVHESPVYDSDPDEDSEVSEKDCVRFETYEKEFTLIPKRGYMMKYGEKIINYDSVIIRRRNTCKVMTFSPEEHTRWNQAFKNKMLDRRESQLIAEMGVDEQTRLILFKLVNNGLLENVNGVISTGKESVILHANSDPLYPDVVLPKECAIKVFKTTLNEFKSRDKYIKADYRFRDRFSRQNPRKFVHMWAEKEMHNMIRIQKIGMNCPEMVSLKKHVLVMSFIGKDNEPAPKLRDIMLKPGLWQSVYNEVVEAMHKLYNVGHLVHADLSEYNILWWENKCWFIDVAQSVQPDHPNGLKFLLRDCRNIINVSNMRKCVLTSSYIFLNHSLAKNLMEK